MLLMMMVMMMMMMTAATRRHVHALCRDGNRRRLPYPNPEAGLTFLNPESIGLDTVPRTIQPRQVSSHSDHGFFLYRANNTHKHTHTP